MKKHFKVIKKCNRKTFRDFFVVIFLISQAQESVFSIFTVALQRRATKPLGENFICLGDNISFFSFRRNIWQNNLIGYFKFDRQKSFDGRKDISAHA